jgi:methionyl aminopeptidase
MRTVGRFVGEALAGLRDLVQPGVTTGELDVAFEQMLRDGGAEPLFKGYRGYPAVICASVNEEVVHGIPGDRRLADGDLVSLDIGARMGGYCGDAALTVPVGPVSDEAEQLLATGAEALKAAIGQMQAGARLRAVSAAIQQTAETAGFSVVRQFVGHSIGREMHEGVQVPNFVDGSGFEYELKLTPGLVLALEPMVNAGTWKVEVLGDGWTVVTGDRQLSVHFEHSVAVTPDGPEVLTRMPEA